MTNTVAIMSPGDMGHSVGLELKNHGIDVITCLDGRSDRTKLLAAQGGFRIVDTFDQMVVEAHLAFCSDLVITAETARFIEIFARRGLVPDGLGAWILPRLIGIQKTKELMFFADDVSAEEALRLGLCNRNVPTQELETKSREWAERLAAGPSRSYMFTKWMLNKSLDVDRITLAEYEAWAVEVNASTHDSKEGVLSFREKRNPEWKGY